MTETQTLALIADIYTPLLVLVLFYYFRKTSKTLQKKQAIAVVISIIIVYLLMFTDNFFSIWLSLGMDYSTHTGIALVFVVALSVRSTLHLVVASLSLLFYCLLMHYLNYHSIADMLTTTLVLLPMLILLNKKGN